MCYLKTFFHIHFYYTTLLFKLQVISKKNKYFLYIFINLLTRFFEYDKILKKGETYMYIFYLILFIALLIVEALTSGFVSIWVSLASLVTCIFAYFFPKMYWAQIGICVAVSLILIILTKPFVNKVKAKKTSTNADRLIGDIAVVTDDIDNLKATGSVKVNGLEWTARSEDGSKIEKNKKVKINKIDGVKLIVAEIKEESLCR